MRQQLDRETLLVYNKTSFTFQMLEHYFHNEGIPFLHFMEMESVEAIKELVKVNFGIGVLASWTVHQEQRDQILATFPLGRKPLKRKWGVVTLKGRELGIVEEAFVGLYESVAENLLIKAERD